MVDVTPATIFVSASVFSNQEHQVNSVCKMAYLVIQVVVLVPIHPIVKFSITYMIL